MRFFGSSKEQNNKKTVLFVCVQNAGRSQQITEAFFRKYAPNNYQVLSTGTEPVGNLNPPILKTQKASPLPIRRVDNIFSPYMGQYTKFV